MAELMNKDILSFTKDVAIDLGTASILVYVKGKGIVLREPSIVALDQATGRLLKIGAEALKMVGRTPGSVVTIRPLQNGVISDYEMTERMLRDFIRRVTGFRVFKPRILICVPGCITEVEERAVIDAGIQAGARRVYLVQEPLAAAIGAGLDVKNPSGQLIVDIGGGTTDVAVLSMGTIVQDASIKVAGDAFNEALIRFIKRKYNILLGWQTAEDIKLNIGSAFPRPQTLTYEAKGRSTVTGLPNTVAVTSKDTIDAFDEVFSKIVDAILAVLENTPPELVGDISANGIVLTGGGSLLWGLDKVIESKTGIHARIADDAISCVAYGTGKLLEGLDKMQDGTVNFLRKKQLAKVQ